MTLDQLIADALYLIRHLRKEFKQDKIYLLARSWGTVAGVDIAHNKPAWLHAYIALGQVIQPLRSDSFSYRYCLQKAGDLNDNRAQEALRKIGYPPYDSGRLLEQRRWLSRLTGGDSPENISASYFDYFRKLLATPEYSVKDILVMGMSPYFSLKMLWNEEYYNIDVVRDYPQLEVPVFFLCGRQDIITPGYLVERYYQQLLAPAGKELFWFEQSGHYPEYSEPEKFGAIISKSVIKRKVISLSGLELN
jgi:pimeloyl-ACP methyl ester carboxylesterase